MAGNLCILNGVDKVLSLVSTLVLLNYFVCFENDIV